MRFKLTRRSGNTKTGPIPVTTTSSDSCPPSCALWAVCYAKFGPLAIHWKRLNRGEGKNILNLNGLINAIKRLPRGTIWRHNQAGDLPGKGDEVDPDALLRITQANRGKKGFTYTHKPWQIWSKTGRSYTFHVNEQAIRHANTHGFTVNISCNQVSEVDAVMDQGLPAVVVLPIDSPKITMTEGGRRVVKCPAVWDGVTDCMSCGNGTPLCQRRDRNYAIGFPAHGVGKKTVDRLARGTSER